MDIRIEIPPDARARLGMLAEMHARYQLERATDQEATARHASHVPHTASWCPPDHTHPQAAPSRA